MRKIKWTLCQLAVIGVLMSCLSLQAAENFSCKYVAPIMEKAPLIDGKFNKGEWNEAMSFDGMQKLDGKLEERMVRTYIGATEDAFYFAIISELPPNKILQTEIKKDNTEKIVFDDACEIFIDPSPDSKNGIKYQIIFNSIGKKTYLFAKRGSASINEWNGKCIIANTVSNGKWIAEIKLPLSAVDKYRKIDSGHWGISVCRDWKRPWKFSSAPGTFNGSNVVFQFERGTPGIQFKFTDDPFLKKIKGELNVNNISSTPIVLSAQISTELDVMPRVYLNENLYIPPGKNKTLYFDASKNAANCNEFTFSLNVQSKKKKLYTRRLKWNTKNQRKYRWDEYAKKENALPFDFEFAYYPYQNNLRIRNIFQSYKGKLPKNVFYSVIDKESNQEIKKFIIPATKNEIFNVKLPNLSGEYILKLTLNNQELSKEFTRKHYEWEHNHLGTSNKVYPPFKPMRVHGNKISTVLCSYEIGANGLPQQIIAKGSELLAGPISLKLNGKNIDGYNFKFINKSDDAVSMSCKFKSGAFKAKAISNMEYDGALKYELTLLPGNVNHLTLEIPIKDTIGKKLYAMSDGLRNNICINDITQKEGEVWNARELRSSSLPEGFCSYIFIGNPLRGLCFFADNDKGWGWDRKTPNLKLVREKGSAKLIINLVNKPLNIKKERRIVFGLQAAPIKPRLADWRTRWNAGKYVLLGTDINWLGGPGCCSNVYPPEKNMYFWKMLAKSNKEKLTKNDIDKCVKLGYRQYEQFSDKENNIAAWDKTARANLSGMRYGRNMVFYYNRAVYNALEEYHTFMNEWIKSDFTERKQIPKVNEIKIIPSESYRDFSVYWYAESFKYGLNKGVYWDNWFFHPSYNTRMTDAYYHKDGSITPACGIWQMRELAKRTFQMMNEKGMDPIIWAHMTSTSILPLLSFATAQLDWEWKYSTGDVQYRFSRSYCTIVSNGELAGVIPLVLGEHGKLSNDEWTQRTFAGVCLVHELQPENAPKKWIWKTLYDPLLKAYSGNTQLKVYRYWDEGDLPVKISDNDYTWILYSLPNHKSLLIICGYKDKDKKIAIDLDMKAIKLNFNAVCKNFETGKSIPISNGKIAILLKKHGVVALEVTNVK